MAEVAGASPDCWYCNGIDSAACPMCSPEKSPDDKGAAIQAESAAVHGQDGWVAPEFGNSPGRQLESVESINTKLFCDAEALHLEGKPQEAIEVINRGLRNLERHFDACEGRGVALDAVRPMMRRGEKELFCIGWAVSARCMLLGRAYENCVEEIKKYIKIRAGLSEAGEFDDARLLKIEKRILANYPPGSTFINQMDTLQAALEIYLISKRKVSSGWAPKVALDHSAKALDGLKRLNADVLLGLKSLCAELHIIKSQAELELERWDEAKEDAEKALQLDAGLAEAEYLLECAENEEW